jgi:hypothetical protein
VMSCRCLGSPHKTIHTLARGRGKGITSRTARHAGLADFLVAAGEAPRMGILDGLRNGGVRESRCGTANKCAKSTLIGSNSQM